MGQRARVALPLLRASVLNVANLQNALFHRPGHLLVH